MAYRKGASGRKRRSTSTKGRRSRSRRKSAGTGARSQSQHRRRKSARKQSTKRQMTKKQLASELEKWTDPVFPPTVASGNESHLISSIGNGVLLAIMAIIGLGGFTLLGAKVAGLLGLGKTSAPEKPAEPNAQSQPNASRRQSKTEETHTAVPPSPSESNATSSDAGSV